MKKWLCVAGWSLAIVLMAVAICTAIILANERGDRARVASEKDDRSPALDYGPVGTVYLSHSNIPKDEHEIETFSSTGGDVWQCFTKVIWKRPLRLRAKVWFVLQNGKRIDYDDRGTVHYIDPPKMGPLQAKCRAWHLPAGLPAGQITMSGLTRPADPDYKSEPIELPDVKFIVQAP